MRTIIIFIFVLLVVVNLLNFRISLFFGLFVCLFIFLTISPSFYLPPFYCKVYCDVMLNDV